MKFRFLQWFAEGGGDVGATGAGETGVQGSDAGSDNGQKVAYGKPPVDTTKTDDASTANTATQTSTSEQKVDPDKTFESLIKGEYKAQYDARMQKAINARFAETKSIKDQLGASQEVLSAIGARYGLDSTSPHFLQQLQSALANDNEYYEARAAEANMTVDQYREFERLRQNEQRYKEIQALTQRQYDADKLYADWMRQSEELKSTYPKFDFNAELANPDFIGLLQSGIKVKMAYEMAHHDEILKEAVQKTKESVSQTLQSNGALPLESGTSAAGSSVNYKSDPSKWSQKEMDDVAERVRRGERIYL